MAQPGNLLLRGLLLLSVVAHAALLLLHFSPSVEAAEKKTIALRVQLQPPPPPPPPPAPAELVEPPPQRRVVRPAVVPPQPSQQQAAAPLASPVVSTALPANPYALAADAALPPAAPAASPVPTGSAPEPQPAAPAVDRVAVTRAFFAAIRSAVDRKKHYPFAAKRHGASGTVRVNVEIGPSGRFSAVQTVASCGHALLDEAALAAVRSVSGTVPLPDAVRGTPLRMTVLVNYHLES